jgi:16S rRNA (cytidine1402-2'-O)-methyltransferase
MSELKSIVYLIPSLLDDEAVETIPLYIVNVVKGCHVLFVENERTARRFLKKISKEIVIDNYEWFLASEGSTSFDAFRQKIKEGKHIGIISEAGCPGVADPGQDLVAIAHKMNLEVKPLVGPNSILLALMASGMNGQQFRFVGYLPINEHERIRAIRDLESESHKKNCTQIFIETPYRNNQLIESVIKTCSPGTKFCIAVDLTGKSEWIRTKKISEWSNGLSSEKKEKIDIHKRPAIFLLLAD